MLKFLFKKISAEAYFVFMFVAMLAMILVLALSLTAKASSPYDVENNELSSVFNQRAGDLFYFSTDSLPAVNSNITFFATTTNCSNIRYILLLRDNNQNLLHTIYSDYNPTEEVQFNINDDLSNVKRIDFAVDSSSTNSCAGNWQTIVTTTANPTVYISNFTNTFSCVQNCTATPTVKFDYVINYAPEFLYPTPDSTINGNVVHVVGYCNEANIGSNVIGLDFKNRQDYISDMETPIPCEWNEAAQRAMWSKDIEISIPDDYTLAVFDSTCYARNNSDNCYDFVDFTVQTSSSLNPYNLSIIYPEDSIGYNYFSGLIPSSDFPLRFSYHVLLDEQVPIRYRDYSVEFYNCDDKTFSQCDPFPWETKKIYDEENPSNSLDPDAVNRFTWTFNASTTTQEYSYRLKLVWDTSSTTSETVYTLNFTLAPSVTGTVLPQLPENTMSSKLVPWIPRDGFYESRVENMKYLYTQRFPFSYIYYLQAKFLATQISSSSTSTLFNIPLDSVGLTGKSIAGGDLNDSSVQNAWSYPRVILIYLIWLSVAFIILRDTLAIFKGSEAG